MSASAFACAYAYVCAHLFTFMHIYARYFADVSNELELCWRVIIARARTVCVNGYYLFLMKISCSLDFSGRQGHQFDRSAQSDARVDDARQM